MSQDKAAVLVARQIDEANGVELKIVSPTVTDGADVWRVARDSQTLDLNSSYAYLLYCHDFARTCRIATVDGEVAGFVLGHRPPERPESLFVWQIAVDERFRGHGIAGKLLDAVADELVASGSVNKLETTITEDNTASQSLFASFAKRWGDAAVTKSPLFDAPHFPDGHEGEPLYEIGPLRAA